MTTKYLDSSGLSYFWGKLKAYFQPMLSSGVNIKTVNNTSLLGSGDLTILPQLVTLSYGNSTWQDFINAYNANCLVYCRASSNSNPATGSQSRMAFMAYVNNATSPTEVEFQYYRSVSSHTASQQGDQVFVYKLTSNGTWTVTVREASVKVVAGTGLGGTYSSGTMTLTGPTKVSDLTNDSGFITDYTETDPVFSASAAAGITSSDITNWNNKISDDKTWNEVRLAKQQGYSTSDYYVSYFPSLDTSVASLVKITTTPTGHLIPKYDNSAYLYSTTPSANDNSTKVATTAYVDSALLNYTETDPVFSASAAHGISSSDISAWNAKQSALGTLTVTLTTAGWSSDAQTVTATGVTSSNTVIIAPSPSNMEDYTDAGIVCTAQGTNSLTFECDTTPSSAIDVNVVII